MWLAEVMISWHHLSAETRPRVVVWLSGLGASMVLMSLVNPSLDLMGHFGGVAGGVLAVTLTAN